MDKKISVPNQPVSFNFPKRTFGKKNPVSRSFQPQWFTKWSWLHYIEAQDSVLCYICVNASLENKMSSAYVESAFLSKGFTSWKDATKSFSNHEQCISHKEAVLRFVKLPKETKDIGDMLSQAHADDKKDNRQCLLKILANIRFLARQGLALRGDGDESDSNFIQIIKLRGEDDSKLLEWMKKRTNKYTSAEMQNEMLQVIALRILREIAQDIRNSTFFSIMADETTDKSNREQVVIVIRHVDENLLVHEEFIGLSMVESLDATTLTGVIKDCLLRMNVALNKCRGQCYDGASNMSGTKSGVAKQISEDERRAVYTHCYGHALNLAAGDSIKRSKIMQDALDTAFEMSKLIKYSPKRDTMFEQIKKELAPDTPGFRVLCPTRWTVRADSLQSVVDNYSVLQELFENCQNIVKDTEVKSRIIGVSAQMTQFRFLFGIMLGQLLLQHTDNLSKALQLSDISAAEGQVLASMCTDTLQKLRSNEKFDDFWDRVMEKSSSVDVDQPTLPRKRKAPKRFEIGSGEASFPHSVSDMFRQHYYEALDLVVNSIKDRFDQPGYRIYKNLQELLLKSVSSPPEMYRNELDFVTEFYGNDFNKNSLKVQLETLNTKFSEMGTEQPTLESVFGYFRDLSGPMKCMFSEVLTLVKLVLVMPATNATSERTFSALRRVKSYLRTTMTQGRLNHLMLLHVHKDKTDQLDMTCIANEFVSGVERRMSVFGKF